ncbi:conserved hypothetical protein [Nocardia seriolae]|nr:conserved hypothetical protein [Nocardia seriolae]
MASPAQQWLFRAVWALGALVLAPSAFLLIGGLTANTAAGESGQVPGVLGLIGLAIGGVLVLAGLLVRVGVMNVAAALSRGSMVSVGVPNPGQEVG